MATFIINTINQGETEMTAPDGAALFIGQVATADGWRDTLAAWSFEGLMELHAHLDGLERMGHRVRMRRVTA